MPAFNDPNTSDRVLAAEIYTRRIRNTVFGAILLIAWLVLLFKELGWGIAVGVAAGVLYGLFLFGRWIVRVCRGGSGAVASRSAPATHRPWRIEPTSGRPAVARPVETLEEASALLDMVKAMPADTRAERERKTHALAVGFGMAQSPSQERRGLLLLIVTAALSAWPIAISHWLGTSSWPVVDWWYLVPGALLFFGGATVVCDAIAGDFRGVAGDFLGGLVAIPAGLWLLLAHPVLGASDPLTKYAVRPVVEWVEAEYARSTSRRTSRSNVDGILADWRSDQQATRAAGTPQAGASG